MHDALSNHDFSTNHAVQKTKIAIIGAGFGGLAMAIRLLQQQMTDFMILEKANEVGGTWRENQYPGAACDVQSHMYSLSFAPKTDANNGNFSFLNGMICRKIMI